MTTCQRIKEATAYKLASQQFVRLVLPDRSDTTKGAEILARLSVTAIPSSSRRACNCTELPTDPAQSGFVPSTNRKGTSPPVSPDQRLDLREPTLRRPQRCSWTGSGPFRSVELVRALHICSMSIGQKSSRCEHLIRRQVLGLMRLVMPSWWPGGDATDRYNDGTGHRGHSCSMRRVRDLALALCRRSTACTENPHAANARPRARVPPCLLAAAAPPRFRSSCRLRTRRRGC